MKLSEIKGERAVEVIADLIEPLANIASDHELKFLDVPKKEGESERQRASRGLTEKIPVLLRTHKEDVLAILCAVNGMSPENLSILDIMKGAIEMANDQDFMSLFMFAVGTGGQTPPTESSVTVEHSEPES